MWKLIPLPYKLIGAGVVLAGILLGARLWLNSHDSKVAQETRVQVSKELDKDFQEKYAAQAKQLAAERAAITADRKRLDADKYQFNREHNAKLKAIQDAQLKDAGAIAAIPPAKRRIYIRAILAELAAIDGGRGTSNPTAPVGAEVLPANR